MQILISSLFIALIFIGAFFTYVNGKAFILEWRRKRIKKRDSAIRGYLRNFGQDEKLAIIDETPREVFIGNRFYLLKPLKYRQYTRLCVLFARTLQKMQEKGII